MSMSPTRPFFHRICVQEFQLIVIQLIDFTMTSHPAYPRLTEMSGKTGKNAFEILGRRLEDMMEKGNIETLSTFLIDWLCRNAEDVQHT